MAIGLISPMDASRREDILDVIQDVTPAETPLMTLFKTSTARNTIHQWVEDYQARKTSTTSATEAADISVSDLTQPLKRTNLTAIVVAPVVVSGTERSINVVGGMDPFDYQKSKQLIGWKLQAEFNLVNGAVASGASGVAAQMAGLQSVVTTHATARSSGTSISVQEINDAAFDIANDVGIANMADLMIVPLRIKQKISTLTTAITRYQEAGERALDLPVQVLATDFGDLRILPHLDVLNSAGTSTIFWLREDKFRVAYLRTPFFQDVAPTGDATKGQWVGELTLEYLAERASAKRTGYAQAG